MIERYCKKCKVPMHGERCVKCGEKTHTSTTIYWCAQCNIPIFDEQCPLCGQKGSYFATDVRPCFPEEKLLVALLLEEKDPLCFQQASMWYGNNGIYMVDGQKKRLVLSQLNKLPIEKYAAIKKDYDKYVEQLDYQFFENKVVEFCAANKSRYDYLTEEATTFIQSYQTQYSFDDMMVSFSGGKDSTVTSSLVNRALGTNKVLHVFGDTTLEFPSTYEYKIRFRSNEESNGVRILTAKNREKNFEELCQVVGPPSRVMRWCCTVFKTGAIQKTISSAYKDKANILTFYGIRRSESASRSKYERESDSPKITKQTVVSPIIDWIDFDVWLYILMTGIDFNDAYRLGYSRVGCWCCPNNGAWSEILTKIHMHEQYLHWRETLVEFAKQIEKPDPEDYVDGGFWKARQGGNGLAAAQTSIVKFEPCATTENAFNYELKRPISDELYELFKPFGVINKELGNRRLGEVYVLSPKGKVRLILQGRMESTKLKVTIKDIHLDGARSLSVAEKKVQCQLTKYQMCLGCKACESVCTKDAISVKDDGTGKVTYLIDDTKCVRCGECVNHFDAGCYMRKVLGIKRQ